MAPLEAWSLGTEKGYTRFFFFLYTLQYCIGFTIHQHESATGVHTDEANAEHDSKENPMKNIQLVPTLQEQEVILANA